MCTVNIRGHEANFYEAEARCHEAEIEAKKWGRGLMIWPRGQMGLEALTSLLDRQLRYVAYNFAACRYSNVCYTVTD